MGQSGRVRCGVPGGGQHGRGPPESQGSPVASRPRSPGTRSARAPRLSNATSRPTPRSRTRSCSPGAARVAASGSSAWTSGGSWSRSPPPACRSAPSSPLPRTVEAARVPPASRGLIFLGQRKGPFGDHRPCLSFAGRERAQLRAWPGTWSLWLRGDSGISKVELET